MEFRIWGLGFEIWDLQEFHGKGSSGTPPIQIFHPHPNLFSPIFPKNISSWKKSLQILLRASLGFVFFSSIHENLGIFLQGSRSPSCLTGALAASGIYPILPSQQSLIPIFQSGFNPIPPLHTGNFIFPQVLGGSLL